MVLRSKTSSRDSVSSLHFSRTLRSRSYRTSRLRSFSSTLSLKVPRLSFHHFANITKPESQRDFLRPRRRDNHVFEEVISATPLRRVRFPHARLAFHRQKI